MILVYLFEFAFVLAVIIVATTQIIVPLWQERPIFPFFRKRRELENAVAMANEKLDESNLKKDAAKIRSRASSNH